MADRDRERSPLEQAASTAHTIHGAIKTGKAIAGAAKGAAVGGPYGAVAGAVWGARKHIGTIAIVVIIILLLPVLFILMLPSIIFGGLFGGSTDPAAEPIMNDNAAIIENTNEIAFAINQILGEGIDDVEQRIASDFAQTGGDNYEIVNPYADDMISNTNAFIGQYCAAKNEDWETISLADLEQTLRSEVSDLYTFSRASETRTIPDNPETEADESGTETWYIYTIVYQGEDHFADEIFHLTDEQKELAEDYAQNLSLLLGDGMFQSASGTVIPSLGSVRFTDGAVEVVYFNQLDERYANEPYGTDDIGGYGCGPTAMSIVVSSLAGDIVDPIEMAQWSYENGYWCSKSGSYHALIPAAAKAWGLPVEGCTASEPQRIVDALGEGKLVVALMTKGHFTSSGHFIVLRGVQDEQILVADPASTSRSQKAWDLSIILNEASKSAAAGGPFWIIG
ncbi:C39 family peptidase [Flavonifractor sp. An306]|uniref:C39 family peptidase n=1 Tax=Flavonifractor sp. An306 TaxID=1965629 RepID=UPI001FA9034E|nr:C39 family peptidase [Flavonifractor sp. An306]